MNELFVSIKVDREERPDIDQIYMFTFVQDVSRGNGAWLMQQEQPGRVGRRLAADVAGYSRLMGLDEVGAFPMKYVLLAFLFTSTPAFACSFDTDCQHGSQCLMAASLATFSLSSYRSDD